MRPHMIWAAAVVLGAAALAAGQPGGKDRPGEVNTPPAKGERHKDAVKVGDVAPDFTLAELKTGKKVALADHRGKQPVVLIFGSYT